MNRTFKPGFFSIAATGTAQPLIGTAVTAAVQKSTAAVNVAVADSSIFELQDWVILVDPSTTPVTKERLAVVSIPDSTHVTVSAVKSGGVANNYTTSSFLQLGVSINNVYIQSKAGNAAVIAIGTDPAVSSSTGAYAMTLLSPVASGVDPTWFSSSLTMANNPQTAGDYWVVGTAGDKYLASLGIT